jgi:predicted XRE-type DNA-binding protein
MTIEHTTPAEANIFEDLGLPDTDNLRLRAQLMLEVRRYVEESGLTQAAAAKAMKTTQPRLSEVLHGRIDKCTIDRLVQMLAEVGRHVTLSVKAKAA